MVGKSQADWPAQFSGSTLSAYKEKHPVISGVHTLYIVTTKCETATPITISTILHNLNQARRTGSKSKSQECLHVSSETS